MPIRLVLLCNFVGYAYSSTFQWPNPLLNYADHQLYEGPLNLFRGCPARDNTTVPAQWLRLAYHDAATHNVDDGTGGADASIMYELDRPQNIGEGMIASLSDFNSLSSLTPMVTPYSGMADVIALGAIFAVVSCGGPVIPFSAGRVDATEAGPPLVPEPQQPLASHIESFRRQGFSETEMIALVACGHTLGGVRQADFPLIVTNTSIDVDTFDTTPAFDTTIVSQYLQNTTQDILVVGPNVTTRSDFRIFSSDGNATMQSLLSPDTFTETCGNLIQRMINNVPNGVNLTDPISEPFDYLVGDPLFAYQNGTFIMTTSLRVLSPSTTSTITMLWTDRQGSFCPSTGCSILPSSTEQVDFSIIGQILGATAERYFFNATINATSSISKFWFEINDNDGSDPVVVDNGGSGFVIEQDSLFVDSIRTQLIQVPEVGVDTKVVVAVRGNVASTNVSVIAFEPQSSAAVPPFLPSTTSINLQLDESNPPEGGFTFFTTTVSGSVMYLSEITSIADGVTYTQENFYLFDIFPTF
ncbi:heme peroxidase [Gymnopus androsaceus JB14]|uniref:Peroxidase n=1 Tax=Gymnopus androsaceus JB14 TaxID=1447944 RepID=A0A6A4HL37_9AGAR|nr:heme peroxidase [Gymnopus androsaceus JB14]